MSKDFGGYFRHLDRLWETGELPQRFSCPERPGA